MIGGVISLKNRTATFPYIGLLIYGGVGKTTVTCGLASVLANFGQRALVVDLDPQSNAGYLLGTDPIAPGTAELLSGNSSIPLEAALGLYVLSGGQD